MIVNDVQPYATLVEVASDLPILITYCVISIRQVIVNNKELQSIWLGMKALPLKWTRTQ